MKRIDYFTPFYQDNFYHVFNRGNGTDKIFYNKENYSFFLNIYRKYLSDFIELYSFCLIPNHFHMLIKITADKPEQVSKQFKDFFISYSMSINKQQHRKGNLFQRRVKRKLICDERYFLNTIHYIHYNPVHHNITDNIENYPYSSYKLIISGNKIINSNEVINRFGGLENYLEFHKKDLSVSDDANFIIE